MPELPLGVAEYVTDVGDLEFRAHHAGSLVLILGGMQVDELLDGQQARAQNPTPFERRWGHFYTFSDPVDSEAFKANSRRQYEAFMALPDDARIWFADHRKDGICAGAHCGSDPHCTFRMRPDTEYLRAIAETATELGLAFDKEELDTVDTTGRPIVVNRVRLTAADARTVLQDPYFMARTTPGEMQRAFAIAAVFSKLHPERQSRLFR